MTKVNTLLLVGGVLIGFSLAMAFKGKHLDANDATQGMGPDRSDSPSSKSSRIERTPRSPSNRVISDDGEEDLVLVSESRLVDLFANRYGPFSVTIFSQSGYETTEWLPERFKFAAEFLGLADAEIAEVAKAMHHGWGRICDNEASTAEFSVFGPNVLRIDLSQSKDGTKQIMSEIPHEISSILGNDRSRTFCQLTGLTQAIESGVTGRSVSYLMISASGDMHYAFIRGERDGAPSSGGSGRSIDSNEWLIEGKDPPEDLFGDRWSHVFARAPDFIHSELLEVEGNEDEP